MFGVLTKLGIAVAGLGWPAYASFKAVESFDAADDRQWLTYWVVFASLSFFEPFVYVLLDWLPLYQELKLLLIVWLVLPQTRGAVYVYDHFVAPFFRRHGGDIEHWQKVGQAKLGGLASPENRATFQRFVNEHGSRAFGEAMRAGYQGGFSQIGKQH
eukprot:SM000016S01837  [mRNA]  locus=s16:94280:95001:- [translate_table: standard]